MKINKKAETFVGIIIGLLIFSLIALSIISITSYNKGLTTDYERLTIENLLKNNLDVISKKLDFSGLKENDTAYIYKNKINKKFELLTGTTNSGSKYIDITGDKITNLKSYVGDIYLRELIVKQDLVKYLKTPSEIPNLVLDLDGQDVNGNGSNTANGTQIQSWVDKSGKNNNGNQVSSSNRPLFRTNSINGFSSVYFDGVNYFMGINSTGSLDSNSFNEKSFAMIFKTGTGLFTTTQMIYEQGTTSTGYALSIEGGNILAKMWGSGTYTIDLGKAYQNTVYSIILVQDSLSTNSAYRKFLVYLNGKLVGEYSGVPVQTNHSGGIGVGFVNITSYGSLTTGNYFSGNIGELISWNHALNKNEVEGINNYLYNKWKNSGTGSNIQVNSLVKNVKFYIVK